MFVSETKIRFSETDETGCLSMSGLLRLFQDYGYFHAIERGQSHIPGEITTFTWYLLSWNMEAYEMPVCGSTVCIKTWIYEHAGSIVHKQICLADESGKILALGDTLWVYMDVLNEKPSTPPEHIWLPEDYGEKLSLLQDSYRIKPCKPDEAGVTPLPSDIVGENLIDINRHANNVLFTEYAMTLAHYRTGCMFLSAKFVQQAKTGVAIYPYSKVDSKGTTVCIYGPEQSCLAQFRFE